MSIRGEKSKSSVFSKLNEKLLSAGKVQQSEFHSSKILTDSSKNGNAIIKAQMNCSLYSGTKVAADPLKAPKAILPKTAGKGWFDLEPVEMDSKLKQDLKMIQMRNYMDPKRFYKNPDKMGTILHTGTVIEGPSEFKSSRLTNRERKQSIVDEILADKKIKDYSKKKFLEIQAVKTNKRKTFRPDKKLKKSSNKKIRKLF